MSSGDVTQGITSADLEKLLSTLTKQVLDATSLTQEQRNDALGDIQTIQAQRTKAKPDKGIIRRAVDGLKVLGDINTIGKSAVALAPYIEHLVHIVEKL
jgi:hypothetical protein